MHITGRVWRALTNIERLAMLESAVKQNARFWQKKKCLPQAIDDVV